jgi:hypothetical protein
MRHFGEAGALAAKQIARTGAAGRLAAAECVDPRSLFPLDSRLRRRGWLRYRPIEILPGLRRSVVRAAVFLKLAAIESIMFFSTRPSTIA